METVCLGSGYLDSMGVLKLKFVGGLLLTVGLEKSLGSLVSFTLGAPTSVRILRP